MKKIRAVLFDMDGLMFDTQRLWDKAWKQAGEACGVPMGEEQIAPIRGRSHSRTRASAMVLQRSNTSPGATFFSNAARLSARLRPRMGAICS